uniref:Type VI secretion system tip protein VgrG n=1 Tax=Steinernema glaseri TaxID=37863 RepID=A0A1I8ABD6_9BILA
LGDRAFDARAQLAGLAPEGVEHIHICREGQGVHTVVAVELLLQGNRDNPYRYDLRFQADEDLLSLFERHTGNGQISERLVCALDGDENFDLEHVITYNLSGSPEFESRAPDGSFNYLAQMSFDKTLPSR